MAEQQWKKDKRPASFRGVPFYVDSHERSGGRRGTQHVYPNREKPYTEEIGRKGGSFNLEGYVIGNDYMPARDLLWDACDKTAGPGELIHPYYGRLLVVCMDVKVKESTRDGGMAVFTFTFAEYGEDVQPTVVDDTGFLINAAADASIQSQKEQFVKEFSVDGLPQFCVDSASAKVGAFADTLETASSGLKSKTDQVNNLAYSISNLRADANDLIHRPQELADNMANALSLLQKSSGDSRGGFTSLVPFFGFGSTDVQSQVQTSTRKAEQRNNDALNQLIQVVAFSEASRTAAEISYQSIDDATVIRESLTDPIDATMEATKNDDTYSQLSDLRTQIVKSIPPPDQDLASISTVKNQVTLPSLVVAYDLYGRTNLEQDIIDRNKIKHPGFLVGGRDLEVLDVE